ncbi:PiggyBac transposable element-derived protein 4 [Araneus ventricosus]|uniref:PiggyBac transposable element-derived protein 4 n=1 Tax=Araneus ventricosus TaxID=182803 RepID=A0A4Y2EHC6_ARAVE|nr:PiggyBac transposable element-derived protein 4 [Araneus ventricosus]
MAKRVKYLSESEISKLLNDSDSETGESSFSSTSNSESDCSDDTEIYDYLDDNANDLSASDWQTDIKELPSLEFSANSGIYINSSEPVEKEIDFFNLFFTNEIIVDETNKFSKLIFEKSKTEPSSSKSQEPKCIAEVTGNEMRVFMSLIILMSIIKKPTIKMYFSSNPILSIPFFSSVMSRNRFLEILKCLHFTSKPDAKKLEKVNLVLEKLIKNFRALYIPEREISVDESFFPWKGRLGFRQYIPSKRSRYGIKIYKLCDSNSGYIWNCLVYTGKDTELTEPGALYGERVVKTLLADLENKGYNLYLDRFFVSPELAIHLLQKKHKYVWNCAKKQERHAKRFT